MLVFQKLHLFGVLTLYVYTIQTNIKLPSVPSVYMGLDEHEPERYAECGGVGRLRGEVIVVVTDLCPRFFPYRAQLVQVGHKQSPGIPLVAMGTANAYTT